MNYEMLRRKNPKYDRINGVMKQLCQLHYDRFPILTSYKLTEELNFNRILDMLVEEGPIRVLVDDRLLPYMMKADKFRLLDIDFAACKGEWARYRNLRLFFYHGAPNPSLAKIFAYNERAILNKQIVFRMP